MINHISGAGFTASLPVLRFIVTPPSCIIWEAAMTDPAALWVTHLPRNKKNVRLNPGTGRYIVAQITT